MMRKTDARSFQAPFPTGELLTWGAMKMRLSLRPACKNHYLLNACPHPYEGLPTEREGAQSGGQASAEQCGPHRVAQALL